MSKFAQQFLVAAVIGLAATLPSKAQDVPRSVGDPSFVTPGDVLSVWAGYFHTHDANGGFAGFVRALNDRNLLADGWLLRGEFAGGQYKPSVAFHSGALMFGYRWGVGAGFFSTYFGTAYEKHDAPSSFEIRGMRGGAKVMVEYLLPRTGDFSFYSMGTYSTNFDTWFAFVRPSFHWGEDFRWGPEARYLQNRAHEAYYVGGFVGFRGDAGDLVISGGYIDALSSGSRNGYYVNVVVNFSR